MYVFMIAHKVVECLLCVQLLPSKVQHWRCHPMLLLLFILAKAGGEKAGGVQIHPATREFIVSSA